MELGTVSAIAAGLGRIDADIGISPVSFDATAFPTVMAADRVRFTRDGLHPDMADWVGPAAPAGAP